MLAGALLVGVSLARHFGVRLSGQSPAARAVDELRRLLAEVGGNH